jgi:RHS repeat-associated protein
LARQNWRTNPIEIEYFDGRRPPGNLAGSAGLKYVLQDLQGSARMAMNNNGSASAVIARHDYLPFGEEVGSGTGLRTGTQGYGARDTNRQKYALTERDAASGLDHTPWRKYENTAGRWTSPDPYKGSMTIANPQSFNRYSYTQNDPVNLVDPSGLNEINNIGTFTVDVPINFGGEISSLSWYYLFWEPGGGGPGGGGPGDGGLGGEPQNPTPTPSPQDDCHRFASLVQGIANNTKNDKEFLDQLARTFTSANNSSTDEMRRNSGGPVNPPRLSFGDSGFKSRLQDGSNQVRHFVAGFIAGANFGLVGLAFMNDREGPNANAGNNADIRLNGVSTNLGSRFTDRADATEFRRARLANEITDDVCQ